MKIILAALLCIMPLVGCDETMESHIAKLNVSGYAGVNDLNVSYVIPEGTVCLLGKKKYYGKVDAYVEARCPDWKGFVLLWESKKNFEPEPKGRDKPGRLMEWTPPVLPASQCARLRVSQPSHPTGGVRHEGYTYRS